MKKNSLLSLVIAASMILSTGPAKASYDESLVSQEPAVEFNLTIESLKAPKITFEVNQSNGKPANGSTVIINSLNDEVQEVLNTKIGEDGIVIFRPQVNSNLIETALGNVLDITYEAIFNSPNGETSVTYFNVPFVKDSAKLSKVDVHSLNVDRNQKMIIEFSGRSFIDELLETKNERINNEPYLTDSVEIDQTISKSMPPTGCETHVSGMYISCIIETKYYTAPVKVASVNVAKDETVEFTFTSSAKVKLTWGQKATAAAGWSLGGTLSKSADVSTGIDFTAPGTCKIFWGVSSCNLQRDFYVNYQYVYTVTDYFASDYSYIDTEYKIVPTQASGPSPLNGNEWVYNSNNGKPKADVAKSTNPHGTWHAVYSGASLNNSYTQEFTYTAGIQIPVIGFSGDVSTAYKNSHTVGWNTTSNKTFYHYDINNLGQNWYVTY